MTEKITHKPIYHSKCGKRIPDRDEPRWKGKSLRYGDELCHCSVQSTTVCSSAEHPIDLDWYDKYMR